MQAADVKFFISDYWQYPHYIAKPVSRTFATANVGLLGKLKPLTKKLEVVDLGYVSNSSFRQRQQLIKRMEKVA